jgi:hypothetical protein
MDKLLEIYSHILKKHLSNRFLQRINIVGVIELNQEIFKVRAIFTANIIFLKYNHTQKNTAIVSNTNAWLKAVFSKNNLFSSIIDCADEGLIDLIDNHLIHTIGLELIDIPSFYENLLSIETDSKGNEFEISANKNYRNKLGSYYTPLDFAHVVTQKTIDTFFELNSKNIDFGNLETALKEISTITFVDFSCGGGVFFTQIFSYFTNLFEHFSIPKKRQIAVLQAIALNISAFDVDCLALEVAKLNVLLTINQPMLYNELSKNFIHANFLQQTDFLIDESQKVAIFSSGFIYHEKLALQKKYLRQYDIILGNPPWEKIRFEEKKFYALYKSSIAQNHFKSTRRSEIKENELNNINLAQFSTQFKIEIEKTKSDLKRSSFFNLSNRGELNTYALFTEAAYKLKTSRGVVGLLLKSSIATSQVNQWLFKYLARKNAIIAIYDFINRNKIFAIDSRERFCFLLLGANQSNKFDVAMNLCVADEIKKPTHLIELSYEKLQKLNPETGMLPNFSTKADADFLIRVSEDFLFFKAVFPTVKFGRIVHFTSHADFISKKQTGNNTPIYEGKFFNQFDGKYAGFNDLEDSLKYGNKSSAIILDEDRKKEKNYLPESRFFIEKEKWTQLSKNHQVDFMLAWRSLTSATNTRTCIATILPFIPASQSVQFLTANEADLIYLVALFNSIVFDFILKKKLSGIDLTQSLINQMPVPNNNQLGILINLQGKKASINEHITANVYQLLQYDIRLALVFKNINLEKKITLTEYKEKSIKHLDLIFMFLYNLNETEIDLVLSVFEKQYSKKDAVWFKKELKLLQVNNTIGSPY